MTTLQIVMIIIFRLLGLSALGVICGLVGYYYGIKYMTKLAHEMLDDLM